MLYEKYGYAIVPKGLLLFRQGSITHKYGTFFALCPNWARNFKVGNQDKVNIYEVKEDIKLLFMVRHLNSMGLPITAIEEVYNLLIDEKMNLNDLDIKWRDKIAKTKFIQALMNENIAGWLSTQENMPPLEIFLMPGSIEKIILKNELKKHKDYNALSYVKISPSNSFTVKSLNNMKPNIDYLLGKENQKEFYSLFEKLFIETDFTAPSLKTKASM